MKYVNLIVFFISFLGMSLKSFSQRQISYLDDEKQFFGGLALGANISQVDGDDRGGYHKAGLNLGALVMWKFANKLSFNMEFLFSQKGSKSVMETHSSHIGSHWDIYRIHLNYIEIPISFSYLHNNRYHLTLGASYNALLSYKEEHETYMPWTIDPIHEFNNTHFEWLAGGNVMINNFLMFTARFQYSITPIRNAENVPQGLGYGRNQFNRLIMFRLTYLFK